MRIQANPSTAASLPSAKTKSSRSAHTGAHKAAAPAEARSATTPAKAAATPAKVAAAAASPETYGGAGSLLDAHA
jgi:hypothetical protein